jgi:hypothetical protein
MPDDVAFDAKGVTVDWLICPLGYGLEVGNTFCPVMALVFCSRSFTFVNSCLVLWLL